MITMNRRGTALGALLSFALAFAPSVAGAQAQSAVITGTVTSEFGRPIEAANVYINELVASVATNAQGVFTITVAPARVLGQAVNLRVRAIGYQPGVRPIRVTAGSQTQNFTLSQDVNRLNEVVVTGSIEATERSKVPFAVGRLDAEKDIPIPALDPIRALEGKVPGVRIAQTSGQPGSTPEILMRGPTSINASGRSQGPLIIVDGVVLHVGSLDELGGMDIESVEIVKGAAGSSLYGTQAASGVIQVKTKHGNAQEGVKFNARSEYGWSDLTSLNYRKPMDHPLQLDETGQRFCVQGAGNLAPCSRTIDWMHEMLRINSVFADTTRSPQQVQWNSPGVGDGSLTNVYQANLWPTYYNTWAQIATPNPIKLNSLDAQGRVAGVRFYASGSYTDDHGGIKGLNGQQQQRARVNLDYDLKTNWLVQANTLYDRGNTDLRGFPFGTLMRGAPPGSDYTRRDSLGRYMVVMGGTGFRPTGNGSASLLYDTENYSNPRTSQRFLGSVTSTFFPADWATFDGTFGYDNRHRTDVSIVPKRYRTGNSISSASNNGNQSIGDRTEEAMNAALTATFRKQLTNNLAGKLSFRGAYDQDVLQTESASGQVFVVKDINTLTNTTTNKTATSSNQTDKNMGGYTALNLDYKGKYILDGTYRYDGSSRFGTGNRWAPFGRVSGVWRVSEESWFHPSHISDFRLRASHGTAGNVPSFTAQYETYTCSSSGCSLGQAGNSKLKPETTTENEFGADFQLFNRLGVELTKADSKTRNQILNVPTPASLGFSNQWQNAGTLANHTWELALNLPVVTKRDLQWSMRGTWDRTRTYITELFMPEYFTGGGTGQGTGSFFLVTNRTDTCYNQALQIGCGVGLPLNQYGNIWGRKFYRTCGDLPSSVQANCGDGKDYQVDSNGWVVWVGPGNTTKDGITKNLWQTKLPAAASPWNYPLFFGMPIVDRPLKGQPGEGIGAIQTLGNTLPAYRMTYNTNVQYKRLTGYMLIDGTFGFKINNQGEAWGLLDLNSGYFDQQGVSVGNAKPLGYGWRAGSPEGAGVGGFYDLLGPNTFNVQDGGYAKIRELSVTYRMGKAPGLGGDWTLGIVGRNLHTWTNYTGYDPEVGVQSSTSQANSGLINQTDAFDFPPLRQFTLLLSTRF